MDRKLDIKEYEYDKTSVKLFIYLLGFFKSLLQPFYSSLTISHATFFFVTVTIDSATNNDSTNASIAYITN